MSEDENVEYKTCVIDGVEVTYTPLQEQPEQLAIGQIWEEIGVECFEISEKQRMGISVAWYCAEGVIVPDNIMTSERFQCKGIAVEEEKEATEMKGEYKGTQLTAKVSPPTTLEVGQQWKGISSGTIYKVSSVYEDYGEAVCDLEDEEGYVLDYCTFSRIKAECRYIGREQEQPETPPTSTLDMVSKPPHYLLFPEHELEAKHIVKRVMDNADSQDFDMSSHEASWLVQSILYMLRFYGKNGWEDIKKAQETLGIAIDSYEERMHNTEAD